MDTSDERDDLPEAYQLETIEQLRALADELRTRITDLLTQQPMTATQLGEVLGVPKAKIHYHVRELERVGLLRLVFTREKRGAVEKYYRTVAKALVIPPTGLGGLERGEVIAATSRLVRQAVAGFLRAAARGGQRRRAPGEAPRTVISTAALWLLPEEVQRFHDEVEALTARYGRRRGLEGEREYAALQLFYDARAGSEAEEEDSQQ